MKDDSSIWRALATNEDNSLVRCLLFSSDEDNQTILQKIEVQPAVNKRLKKRYEKNWDIFITNQIHQVKAKTVNISTTGVLIDRLIGWPFPSNRLVHVLIHAEDVEGLVNHLKFTASIVPGLDGLSCRLMFVAEIGKAWTSLDNILKGYERLKQVV